MEAYSSIFSNSTTNSGSSSSTNFPFSLSSFDGDYDHDHNIVDHNGYNNINHQYEPLITGTMMVGQQQQQRPRLSALSVVQSQPLIDNYDHHNNGQGDDHDGDKSKKGSSDKKIKKHRYAFQTRSQVDILDDGYRWRKYGQKAVKNNKFPRSYYRCTSQGCNVKKQVQRLSKDEGVVVTTYEGVHSHPIDKSTDNFEHILSQMQIYTSF